MSLLEMMSILRPQSPPEPRGVTFVHDEMRNTKGPRYEVSRVRLSEEVKKERKRIRAIAWRNARKAMTPARPPRERVPGNKVMVGEVLQKAVRMRTQDLMPIGEIAGHLGVNYSTVRRALRKEGI